jgi:rhodanese-related sulfurtransferase
MLARYISVFTLMAVAVWSCQAQSEHFERLSPEEVMEQMPESSWQIVDVRTPAEVKRGYLKGTTYFFDFNSYDFEEQVEQLDTAQAVLLICRSGARSSRAAELLKEKGFGEVYDLKGGLMRWNHPGYIVK